MKYLAVFVFLFLLPSNFITAQTNLQFGEKNLAIETKPPFPSPEGKFTAVVDDYSLPTQGVGIRWFVDGVYLPELDNKREAELVTKPFGSATKIEIEVALAGGGKVKATRVIEPIYLDLVIEPQTRTAPFFKGRALPSLGSRVNVTALINGNNLPPANLLYTWRLNNKVLEGGSMRGKNTITITMPHGRFATLHLDVRNLAGEPLARQIIDIPNIEPSLSFYELNTLYGLKQKAYTGEVSLSGSSITIHAEPYNLDLGTFNKPDFLEWKIDGIVSANDSNNPYQITVASRDPQEIIDFDKIRRSAIYFHVRNTVQLLQGAKGTLEITY